MFSIPKIESVERIVDEDPNLYIKRAERFIQDGLWFSALKECNTAVKIASDSYNNRSHYLYECAKVLFKLHKYTECNKLIQENINNFKKDFTGDKYQLVMAKFTDSKKKNDFKSLLIENDQVEVRYLHTPEIKTVKLIGDLTSNKPIELKKEGQYWSIKFTNLKVGAYNYKFVVNNEIELDVYNEFLFCKNEQYSNVFIVTRPNEIKGEHKTIDENETYVGNLKNGEPRGIGILYIKRGNYQSYVHGEFNDGEPSGQVAWYICCEEADIFMYGKSEDNGIFKGIKLTKFKESNSSSVEIGDLKKSQLEGYGIKTDTNGVVWKFSEGKYKEGCINGKGKINFYSEGTLYEGDLVNDLPHGYGVENFNLGQKYEGNFVNGEFNGKGTFTWQDKQKFSGEFLNGRIGNYGEYTIPDVGSYKGYVKNTNKNSLMFHGKGVFRCINGDVYDGEFTNHNYHGRGKYVYKDGKVLEGKFSEGKFVGQSSGGCYLTTAMCTILGKPDDCYELETLRKFRDISLITTDKGKELVDEYYRIAPEVSEKLYEHICRDKIATNMKNKYINKIIDLIKQNEHQKAMLCYKDMVNYVIEAVKN